MIYANFINCIIYIKKINKIENYLICQIKKIWKQEIKYLIIGLILILILGIILVANNMNLAQYYFYMCLSDSYFKFIIYPI